MPESVEDKIRTWLAGHGYRFELIVARAFQRAGFSVTVSEFACDPESGEPREIDVVATHTSFLTRADLFDVTFIIECKHSRDKPWIIFVGGDDIDVTKTTELLYRFATKASRIALLEMSIGEEARQTGLFALPRKMGHGVRRAFEEKTDLAYDAVTKVCAGAAGFTAEKENKMNKFGIVFPVVIIQGQMFECGINEATEIELNEVKQATIFWRRPIADRSIVPVELLTEDVLADFANAKFKQCEALRKIVEGGLPQTKAAYCSHS